VAYALEFLSTFSSAQQDERIPSVALVALQEAIQESSFYNFGQLKMVPALASLSPTLAALVKELAVQTSFANFITFYQQHGSRIEQELKITSEAVHNKMRLLVLMTLASRHVSEDLSYASIAEALQIPLEDVEAWLIESIQAGLVQARLNQIAGTVAIGGSCVRNFGTLEWQEIKKKVDVWRGSLGEILQVLNNAKLISQSEVGVPSSSMHNA